MSCQEFKECFKNFLTHLEVERNLSENTLRAYESDLEHFWEFWQKSNQAHTELPMRLALERYLVSLYHKKIQKSSIARKLSCFKSFERYANKNNFKLKLKMERPRIDKKLPVYLSVDEIFFLLDKVNDQELPTKRPLRDKAILELLYATGIRCSELVNIKIRDINLDEKVIVIFGKGRKERLALFGSKAHERLTTYIMHERPPIESAEEPLFVNFRNKPLTTRSVQRILQMFRTFLKLDRPLTPHKIRHSFATHLLNQGTDLRVVQELLGHKTLSSTERYTHVTTAHLMKLCDTIHPFNAMNKDPEDQ